MTNTILPIISIETPKCDCNQCIKIECRKILVRVRSPPRRYQATTLGKLFTPTCLDADSLRYYMVSLKPGTFTFTFTFLVNL